MVKYIIAGVFTVLTFLSCEKNNQPDIYWSFEKGTLIQTESTKKTTYTPPMIYSNFDPEFVKGIKKEGVRLDGNTTYIESSLKQPIRLPFTLTVWAALETFPTDMASFVTLSESKESNYLSIGLNKFGHPVLMADFGQSMSQIDSSFVFSKFSWHQLTLIATLDEISFFVDGELVGILSSPYTGEFNHILAGKAFKESFVHIFPTMHINGILDELSIWQNVADKSLENGVSLAENSGKTAFLATPESRFAEDHNRPKYHLQPSAQWTNETHGLIYHNGRYHIFNQKNGTNVFLGQINWGHFSSHDLVQWTEHKPVLSPEEGYDEYGIWSGHTIIENGQPLIFYTGSDGKKFGMCMAKPLDDQLLTWEKYIQNPVVYGTPEEFEREDFRDPWLWKEEDTWYMIVGYGIDIKGERQRGTVLLYKSKDLKSWESLGTLVEGNPEVDNSGVFWEMPVFWQMNGKYILVVNPIPYNGVPANCIYWVGDFVNERFVPDHPIPEKLEIINRMLSPSVSYDAGGKTTAMAIIPDLIPAEMQLEQGWTHLYSIPRVWELDGRKLYQTPHPALRQLRDSLITYNSFEVLDNETKIIGSGSQMEIIAHINNPTRKFGFTIGKSPDGKEETKIIFDLENEKLIIDQTNTSIDERYNRGVEEGELPVDLKPFKLHLFIDGSVVEGFIDDKFGFTTRIFPTKKESSQIEIFNDWGILKIDSIELWELNGSNNIFDF